MSPEAPGTPGHGRRPPALVSRTEMCSNSSMSMRRVPFATSGMACAGNPARGGFTGHAVRAGRLRGSADREVGSGSRSSRRAGQGGGGRAGWSACPTTTTPQCEVWGAAIPASLSAGPLRKTRAARARPGCAGRYPSHHTSVLARAHAELCSRYQALEAAWNLGRAGKGKHRWTHGAERGLQEGSAEWSGQPWAWRALRSSAP